MRGCKPVISNERHVLFQPQVLEEPIDLRKTPIGPRKPVEISTTWLQIVAASTDQGPALIGSQLLVNSD